MASRATISPFLYIIHVERRTRWTDSSPQETPAAAAAAAPPKCIIPLTTQRGADVLVHAASDDTTYLLVQRLKDPVTASEADSLELLLDRRRLRRVHMQCR